MKFPANCLVVALAAKVANPSRVKIRTMRNRSGRIHFMWERDGQLFEFRTPGASRCTYLRNALRLGEIHKVPASAKREVPGG